MKSNALKAAMLMAAASATVPIGRYGAPSLPDGEMPRRPHVTRNPRKAKSNRRAKRGRW